ncbi:unnamed protein product [Nesidiocoris tenuis]|uniref:Uncharacterized protein n=1 Tax=Nesidiocoris tenuis TaxID=355587 RepID=A0A6H5HSE4_9HEMI|nr:unnamed protein product [Nesidiocoris tenuis]
MRFSQFNTCVEWSTLAINASIIEKIKIEVQSGRVSWAQLKKCTYPPFPKTGINFQGRFINLFEAIATTWLVTGFGSVSIDGNRAIEPRKRWILLTTGSGPTINGVPVSKIALAEALLTASSPTVILSRSLQCLPQRPLQSLDVTQNADDPVSMRTVKFCRGFPMPMDPKRRFYVYLI